MTWPDPRDLRAPTETLRVGLLRLFDLEDCGVGALVAERNSALGRTAPDSRTLLYEHRLLARLTRCRATRPADDEALGELLDETLAAKRRNASAAFWNATFGSREFAALFSRAASPLPLEATPDSRSALRALTTLAALRGRLGDPDLVVDEEAYWEAYRVLERERYGGRLLASLNLLGTALAETTPGVAAVAGDCARTAGELSTARDRWRGVVGPYAARVTAAGARWLDPLHALATDQRDVMPADFATWYARTLDPSAAGSAWRRFLALVEAHEAAWTAVGARCGGGARGGHRRLQRG